MTVTMTVLINIILIATRLKSNFSEVSKIFKRFPFNIGKNILYTLGSKKVNSFFFH